jgi:hypothetical protein
MSSASIDATGPVLDDLFGRDDDAPAQDALAHTDLADAVGGDEVDVRSSIPA